MTGIWMNKWEIYQRSFDNTVVQVAVVALAAPTFGNQIKHAFRLNIIQMQNSNIFQLTKTLNVLKSGNK